MIAASGYSNAMEEGLEDSTSGVVELPMPDDKSRSLIGLAVDA